MSCYGFGFECCCDFLDSFDEDTSSLYTANDISGTPTWNYNGGGYLEQTTANEGTYYRIADLPLNDPDIQIRLSAKIRQGSAGKVGIFVGGFHAFYANFDLGVYDSYECDEDGDEDTGRGSVAVTPADDDVIAIEIYRDPNDGDNEHRINFLVNGTAIECLDPGFTPFVFDQWRVGVYSDGGGEWEWLKLECDAEPTKCSECDETECESAAAAPVTACSACSNTFDGWAFYIDAITCGVRTFPGGWYFVEHQTGCVWESGNIELPGLPAAKWRLEKTSGDWVLTVESNFFDIEYSRSTALECLCRNAFEFTGSPNCTNAPAEICLIPLIIPINESCTACEILPRQILINIEGSLTAHQLSEDQFTPVGLITATGVNTKRNPCGDSCADWTGSHVMRLRGGGVGIFNRDPAYYLVGPTGSLNPGSPTNWFYNFITDCARATNAMLVGCSGTNPATSQWQVVVSNTCGVLTQQSWITTGTWPQNQTVLGVTAFEFSDVQMQQEGCLAEHSFHFTNDPFPPSDPACRESSAIVSGSRGYSGGCVGWPNLTVKWIPQI